MIDPTMPSWAAIALVSEAQRSYPNECCGFVMRDWSRILIPNRSPEPDKRFEMDQSRMLDVLLTNMAKVEGIYHSHPLGRVGPSTEDCAIFGQYPMFRFWIVTTQDVYEWGVKYGEPFAVRASGERGQPGVAYPVLKAPAEVRYSG